MNTSKKRNDQDLVTHPDALLKSPGNIYTSAKSAKQTEVLISPIQYTENEEATRSLLHWLVTRSGDTLEPQWGFQGGITTSHQVVRLFL